MVSFFNCKSHFMRKTDLLLNWIAQQFFVLEVPHQSVFFPPALALHMSSLRYNSFLCGLWRNWDKLNGKYCCSVFAVFFYLRVKI